MTELLPVQALALVNRWAKLRKRFEQSDIDFLYKIKDAKLSEWVRLGEVTPTRIIRRKNPTIEAMRVAVENKGKDLHPINDKPDSEYWLLLPHENINFYALKNFCEGEYEGGADPENYPEPIEEIETAIAWARTLVGEMPAISELDSDFITEHLEPALSLCRFNQDKELALDVFEEVLKGKLTKPEDIFEWLDFYNLDYSDAIGMHCYENRNGDTTQGNFNVWHKINLSPTGLWLVEFQSVLDESIIFHCPYDQTFLSTDALSKLAIADSDEKFGREITKSEQQEYPLPELLEILGYDEGDCPCGLRQKYNLEWEQLKEEYWDYYWS